MIIPMQPIGFIHSCFPEKFGIPRQAGLVAEACATLELVSTYDTPEAVRGLEGFSHVWLVFVFHAHLDSGWKPTVRPPRLGGQQKAWGFRYPVAVSPPTPIGMSAVTLDRITTDKGHTVLHLRGVDLLGRYPGTRHQALPALRRCLA